MIKNWEWRKSINYSNTNYSNIKQKSSEGKPNTIVKNPRTRNWYAKVADEEQGQKHIQ